MPLPFFCFFVLLAAPGAPSMDEQPLLHVANVLYLVSYSVRDILWLRVLSVLAMTCMCVCYVVCQTHFPLMWQLVFIAINIVQIILLLLERRPVNLSTVERKMYETALKTLTPQHVRRLMNLGEWLEVENRETIIPEGTQNDSLLLLTDGAADVVADGKRIAALRSGQFVGEMSFLTGSATSARVSARGPVKYVKWSEEVLRHAAERDTVLGTSLQSALGADLVWKLLDQRSRTSRGEALEGYGTITLPPEGEESGSVGPD